MPARLGATKCTKGSAAPAWSASSARATVRGGSALRADMDAGCRSSRPRGSATAAATAGACTPAATTDTPRCCLGAARYLAATRRFDGTLVLIFQPAEEGQGRRRGDARRRVAGALSCDTLFGMHNMPGLEAGHLGFRAGPMMASQDLLSVTLEGVGGHWFDAAPEASIRCSPRRAR
ncbi:M20/M25/M40 family metallo-hydrolase [Pseudomonas aeruginosa]